MTAPGNEPLDHLVYRICGSPDGPTLLVFGSLHGNETAGSRALERVAERLRAAEPRISGRLYFFRGNLRAIEKGVRFIDRDLNRHWTPENVICNLPDTAIPPQFSEDEEQAELLEHLVPIIRSARNEVYAIDLHSTSAESVPFATVGDTLRNRAFAQKFPVTILLGIEEQLDGTLLEYLNNLGCITLGYEGGQHYAESTVDIHEALIWRAMVNSGIIADSDQLDRHDQTLERATGHPRVLEVRYRHAVSPEDAFEMLPGFNNFDPIEKGQRLAVDSRGEVRAREAGLVLMPLYQKLGEDGYFIGREISAFWLWLSGALRRAGIPRWIHILPGVARAAHDPDTFEVDTAIARFFPLQILHLLGFRKRRWVGDKLVVSRRKYDTHSPFHRQ